MNFWKIIKSNLLDRFGNIVEGDICEELAEIPWNYKRYVSIDGCLNSYYIIKNTKRFFLFKHLSWFDKTYYTVFTNIKIGESFLKFDTKFNYAIESQINLHNEAEIYKRYKNQ